MRGQFQTVRGKSRKRGSLGYSLDIFSSVISLGKKTGAPEQIWITLHGLLEIRFGQC